MLPMLKAFFSDHDGRIVIAQRPNIPLLVWLASTLAREATSGAWVGFFAFLASAALLTWAYLEITAGASPFRRSLGAVVLVYILLSRIP